MMHQKTDKSPAQDPSVTHDATPGTVHAALLHVQGIVQGVGFRPTVYNLATNAGLSGWVLNADDGVHIWIEGPA